MKRAIAVAIALACAACGQSTDTPVETATPQAGTPAKRGAENEAPSIESAVLMPEGASASDALTLESKVRDPERDRLTTSVEWYKNGVLVPELTGTVVDGGTFSRGDRVYAILYVSDGSHDVNAQTGAVSIANSPPRVTSAFVGPGKVTAGDILIADVAVEDADGDSVELLYRWYRNGTEIPAATTSRLSPGTVKRGDKVGVAVAGTDGNDEGDWFYSPPAVIANAEPVITSQPSYEMTPTGSYSYAVAAKDADGDAPLRFELVEGPPGMTVDSTSGVVSWPVPASASGNSKIEIAVSDSFGGRTTQNWVLNVDWAQAPANASEAPQKKPAKKPAAAETESPAAESESSAEEDSLSEKTTIPSSLPPERKTAPATNAPAKTKAAEGDDTEQDQGEEAVEEEF